MGKTSGNGKIQDIVRDIVLSEGFSVFGVAAARTVPGLEREYRRWLDNGFHGTMTYLAGHAAMKFDPNAVLPGCSSILFAGLNYYQESEAAGTPRTGRISRYAWGKDYHPVIGRRLRNVLARLESEFPGERWKPLADASPLSEKYYASTAGIGSRGRNCLLINPAIGSWFFIGEILTTANLTTDPEPQPVSGCPEGCRRCIEACPTKALYAPHRLDASRCVSYLTIEYRGIIPQEHETAIGDRLFGCDACQEVCPRNAVGMRTGIEEFLRHAAGPVVPLGDVLALKTNGEAAARFPDSPLLRRGRNGLVRNACIAAGNSGDRSLLDMLVPLCSDPDPAVARHARNAADRIKTGA